MKKVANVFVLGWGGSHPKQLTRYTKMWEKFNTLPVTENVKMFQFNWRVSYPEEAVIFYKNTLLPATKSNELPIVFHAFSNNGSAALSAVLRSMEQTDPELKKRVKGVIFDSAPTPLTTIMTWSRAFYNTQIPSKFKSAVTYSLTMPIFISMVAYRNIYVKIRNVVQPGYEASVDPYLGLPTLDLPTNQMYLYSTADLLCFHKYIRIFHETQKAKANDVTFSIWEDSPHVAHHVYHQDEYEKLCQEFLNKCLKS